MEASGSDTTEREALSDTDERRTVWLDTSEGPALDPGTGERDPVAVDTEEREATEREGTERDTTDDWRIEPGAAPATVAELEKRIDVAVATARAAEEAAMEIGAAGLEAAEQARRAAELAEGASAAAVRAANEASTAARSAERAEAAASSAATATVPVASETAEAEMPTTPEADEPVAPAVEPAVNRPGPADFLPRPDAVRPDAPTPSKNASPPSASAPRR